MSEQHNMQQPLAVETRHPIPPSPVHPLAALVTIVLDNVFGVIEIVGLPAILFTSLGVGALCATTCMLVQRYLAKDGWGASVAKGLVMGIIAGVPFQVTGTAVGIPLLAWAGLHEWVKTTKVLPKPEHPAETNVIEAEYRDVG